MKSIEYLKKNRIGALVVIERDVSLQEYIGRATKIYADISSELLSNLFYPNSPLHDGGVIIAFGLYSFNKYPNSPITNSGI